MNLKKILLTSFMVGGLALSASAVEFDYALGFGGGFQNSIYKKNVFKDAIESQFKSATRGIPMEGGKFSEVNWNLGGFVGAGALFGEGALTSSLGLEWTGQFQSFDHSAKFDGDVSGWKVKLNAKDNMMAFGQFADAYYRLGLNFIKAVPMSLQFNVGMAHRALLEDKVSSKVSVNDMEIPGYSYSTSTKFDGKGKNSFTSNAFGVHVGARFNVHMFFMGVDYSYLPSYTLAFEGTKMTTKTSDEANDFSGNQVSFTMGLTLNKAILDSFMGK